MSLLDKLQEFGCNADDLSKAKERFLNNEAFYERCFGKYLADKSFEGLGEALKTNDAKKIFEEAHTLKGVSANMGITPIYEEVVIIVEAVRETTDVPEGLEANYKKIMEYRTQLKDMVG